MMISVLLVLAGTAVVYPGDPALWSGATPAGDRLIGDYSGDLYEQDGVTKAFDWEPYSPPQPTLGSIITRLAFLQRFVDEEAIVIDLASIGDTVEAATIRRYLSKINAAEHIDLQLQELRDGVLALEAAELLAAGRAVAILDTPVEFHERPSALQLRLT